MKKALVLALGLLISVAGVCQSWSLDKAHSKLNFSIVHLLVSDQEGSFKKIDSRIISSKDDFTDATIEFTADVNSIDTDNDKRDEHLKGRDYFDAAKYPTLSFKSTSFTKVEGKKYKLTGNLTLHGVTKPVELDVIYNGTITHPMNKKLVSGFKVSGQIKRSDFGIGTETPTSVLGDEITLTANAEFIKD